MFADQSGGRQTTSALYCASPVEKDAALYVVEDKAVLELVSCVIAAVTDRTQAPRYDDTGWTYKGAKMLVDTHPEQGAESDALGRA